MMCASCPSSDRPSPALRIVVMGVSGAGKTTFGLALAGALGAQFVDADDLHPPANIAKMRAGIPLDDADRAPWLKICAARLAGSARVVLACSALRRIYRDRLRGGVAELSGDSGLRFLWLDAPEPELAARVRVRSGHFMPPALLQSQLAIFEPPGPDEALRLDTRRPLPDLIDEVRRGLLV